MTLAPQTSVDSPRPGLRDPVLWVLLVLGLVLRAGLLARYPHTTLTGDEGVHYVSGVLTSEFGPRLLGMWPPGYEVFLGSIFSVFGADSVSALAAQVALSTVTIGLIYGIAGMAGGRRAARLAAVIAALYPSFIAYSTFFFSETLFVFLSTAGAFALVAGEGRRSMPKLALAGALFGLAVLTRSAMFWFLPVWAAWLLVGRRWGEARRFAVVLGVAVAVVAPWTLRNWSKYDGFLLVDGTLGRRLYLAYSQTEHSTRYGQDLGFAGGSRENDREREPCAEVHLDDIEPLPPATELVELFPEVAWTTLMPARQSFEPRGRLLNKIDKARQRATVDLVAMQACETSGAVAYVKEHPGRVLGQCFDRVFAFWGPTSFLLRSIDAELYESGPLAKSSYSVAKWLVVISDVSIVALAVLALGRRRELAIEWGWALAGVFTLMHALSEGSSRYRLPLMPLLIVAAAVWCASPERPRGKGTLALVVGLEVAFLALATGYVITVLP